LPENKWLVLPVEQLSRVRNDSGTDESRRKNLLPPLEWDDPEV
jgi:hypothetical protein